MCVSKIDGIYRKIRSKKLPVILRKKEKECLRQLCINIRIGGGMQTGVLHEQLTSGPFLALRK